jgi:hypothetical protein
LADASTDSWSWVCNSVPEVVSCHTLQTNGGSESDEQLRQRFEKEILPKIQEQLKGLDQNEQPNSATIELKRQLRASCSRCWTCPQASDIPYMTAVVQGGTEGMSAWQPT